MRTILLLFCFSPMILTSEVPDETLILRLRPSLTGRRQPLLPHPGAEAPSPANCSRAAPVLRSRAFLLLFTYFTRDPLTSSPPLPSISCFGSSQGCAWKSNQEWKKINVSRAEKVFIKVPEAIKSCNFNNGDCEWECRVPNQGARVCHCPQRYTLNSDGETCTPTTSGAYKLTGENDTFTVNGYSNNEVRSWLIVATRGRVIKVLFSLIRTESGYDFVSVYQGTENTLVIRKSGSYDKVYVTSTHRAILVKFTSDGSNTGTGFIAQYWQQEPSVSVIPTLQLNNIEGYLSTPIVLPDLFCVTTVYSAPSKENLSIYIGSNLTGATHLLETHYHQIDNWHIRRFKKMYTWKEIGMTQNLTVKMTGQGNKIMGVSACDASADEDVYNLGISSNITSQMAPISESKNCYHGGNFSTSYNACICPSGFTGVNCTEGCGPNRYGSDCDGVCSAFGKDCQNLIFCKYDLPCFCAPGIKGRFCNKSCYETEADDQLENTSNEYYGASCSRKCGECLNGGCDPVTGVCANGCKNGYYPPLCQETYSRIAEAPGVIQTKWNYSQIYTNFSKLNGKGTPKFYQILLQEWLSNEWIDMKIHLVTEVGMTNQIGRLKAGTKYKVRIIIINKDGGSYEGELIPLREFKTTCSVPDSYNYQLRATNIAATSFSISWNYDLHKPSYCPVIKFEVTVQYRRQNLSVVLNPQENTKLFTDLQPGTTYYVSVQAITDLGRAPISAKVLITTTSEAPGLVRLLQESSGARQLHVTWEKPWSTGGNITSYRVVYQCKKLLACPLSCEDSKGEKEVYGTSADIDNLMPHAQYLIRVAGKSASLGPYNYIYSVTDQTVPSATPVASGQPIVSKTNTSVTVQWIPPSCSGLNGYSKGYYYELTEVHPTERRLLQHGTSVETWASFHSLKPYTNFEVNVYALNMVGKNMAYKLSIPVTTAASVPEAVENLTVYKTGRRMLGIRWAPASQSTGTLKSFSISYRKDGQREIREAVGMKPCSAWPSMYCHTITKLLPDTIYFISVRAHNVETDNDGQAANITAVTREGVPGVPTNLHVSKVTNESLQIEWGLPYVINGMLRSFLINVEHTDSVNITDCCEYFPVDELPVHEEAPVYTLEVSGLRPAATYTISVSAKTLTMGPAVNMTYNTLPPVPANMIPPEIISKQDGACSVKLTPSVIPPGLNGTYLLLILPHKDYPEPEIFDKKLAQLLNEAVNKSFYIVTEFSAGEIGEGKVVRIGTKTSAINGKTAVLQDPELPQEFDVGLALVFDYGGAKSVGFVSSV